jgi:hypothetical protein
VTTTDGHSDAVVWGFGSQGSLRFTGFDGDTGAVVFAGGGANDVVNQVQAHTSPIVAKGRMYIASDIYMSAFTVR